MLLPLSSILLVGCILASILFSSQSEGLSGDEVSLFGGIGAAESLNNADSASMPSFSIAMTTIPPRFAHLHESLLSWLQQDTIAPTSITIFIPSYYRRFKSKSRPIVDQDNSKTSNSFESFKDLLMRTLRAKNDRIITNALNKGIIEVIEIKNDWGPISRIVGLLDYFKEQSQGMRSSNSDFWIVCDDDVRYVNDLLLRYNFAIAMKDAICTANGHNSSYCEGSNDRPTSEVMPNPNPNHPWGRVGGGLSRLTLTQFATDFRLIVSLSSGDADSITAESNLKPRRIAHLQAVDTYLLPSKMLHSQLVYNGPFSALVFKHLVREVHKTCPLNFYQDDYVVSFILSISGVSVTSITKNE
jgi:hypothetical protein